MLVALSMAWKRRVVLPEGSTPVENETSSRRAMKLRTVRTLSSEIAAKETCPL